jgi:hypothetical protein
VIRVVRRITGLVMVMVAGGITEAHSAHEALMTYYTSPVFALVLLIIIVGSFIIG